MQQFHTLDVGNRSVALYQLSVRDPSQAFADLMTYTFPLSPAAVRSEPNALSTFSDTQGTSLQSGVSRVVDTYGLAPPIFTIEGTTGWDRHSTDGYVLDGLQSIILLRNFIDTYIQLNQISAKPAIQNYTHLNFMIILRRSSGSANQSGHRSFVSPTIARNCHSIASGWRPSALCG